MKIVKFKDGTFGVRKGFFWHYQYLDVSSESYWWNSTKYINTYAKVPSLEEAETMLVNQKPQVKDRGTPV